MALTYEQSAALMNDQAFRNRVKVACLHYAEYIAGEATSTPAHNTRFKWAQEVFNNPDGTAAQVTPATVMDAAVQGADLTPEGDSTLDDAGLQSAVETTINKMM
jgi:hypothetical protein